jgi:hypothetical protein
LLDTEIPVQGVTTGEIRPELLKIAVITKTGGGALHPNEFAMRAGWGHFGKGGAIMPGRGKTVLRPVQPGELVAGSDAINGQQTYDVWMNDAAYWRNIPPAVWEYSIGGYQVMKKWLSYRERDVLGRLLSVDEVREVTAMARRISSILALHGDLDASPQTVVADSYTSAPLQ